MSAKLVKKQSYFAERKVRRRSPAWLGEETSALIPALGLERYQEGGTETRTQLLCGRRRSAKRI